jgi:hypothetical protein
MADRRSFKPDETDDKNCKVLLFRSGIFDGENEEPRKA